MSEEILQLDIEGIINAKIEDLKKSKPIEIQCLEKALQSINKRMEYCIYHYDEFLKYTDTKSLFIDRIGTLAFDNITIRTIYEANTIAFLHNLHALFDSFPYALNIIFRTIDDLESNYIDWRDDFIKKYKDHLFYNDLKEFSEDETFQKLKGFVNRSKHKHLIRIKNSISNLVFEEFTYYKNKEKKYVKDQDVSLFMICCHDTLLKKFFALLDSIKKNQELNNASR